MLSKEVSVTIFWDSTWDWNPVSRVIGEHSTHMANRNKIKMDVIFLYAFLFSFVILSNLLH